MGLCLLEGQFHPEVEVSQEEHVVELGHYFQIGIALSDLLDQFVVVLDSEFAAGGTGSQVAGDEEVGGLPDFE